MFFELRALEDQPISRCIHFPAVGFFEREGTDLRVVMGLDSLNEKGGNVILTGVWFKNFRHFTGVWFINFSSIWLVIRLPDLGASCCTLTACS